jgi:IclR family KDG regulon transcriptional repressor
LQQKHKRFQTVDPGGRLPVQSAIVTAIDKAMRVLDVLADSPTPMGLSEVVAAAGLPKPTVRRLLLSLIGQSLVLQNDNGSYELGSGVIELATRALSSMSLADESHQALVSLRDHVTGTIVLNRFAAHSLTAVTHLDSADKVYVVSPPARAPLYATAAGKAVLAFLPESDRRRLVPDEFRRLTEKTLAGTADLEQEVLGIRQRGYAVEDEEAQTGIRAIASPLRNFTGQPIGALAVAAAAKITSMPELVRMATYLMAAADDISHGLGGAPFTAFRRGHA